MFFTTWSEGPSEENYDAQNGETLALVQEGSRKSVRRQQERLRRNQLESMAFSQLLSSVAWSSEPSTELVSLNMEERLLDGQEETLWTVNPKRKW